MPEPDGMDSKSLDPSNPDNLKTQTATKPADAKKKPKVNNFDGMAEKNLDPSNNDN